jgi:hypothetical protein
VVEKIMKNKKTYLANIIYSIYIGVIMGFIITSVFLVIITNLDKYFFNSFIGISGDWLYYLGTVILVPIFGAIYVYNKRIVIENNTLFLKENSFSFNTSKMDITTIKSVSLHKQEGRKRIKKGIKFADGETALMILIKPFSNNTLSMLLKDMININPKINIDDFYKKIIK